MHYPTLPAYSFDDESRAALLQSESPQALELNCPMENKPRYHLPVTAGLVFCFTASSTSARAVWRKTVHIIAQGAVSLNPMEELTMRNTVLKLLSLTLIVTLGLGVLILPSAVTSAQSPHNRQRSVRNAVAKTGAEVAARIRQLKEQNREVRAALRAFERNGRAPKLDDALMISGTVERSTATNNNYGRGLFHKASFRPTQETISGDGYEATFIPSYHQGNEWQGTVIATHYDEYGNIMDQRTFNVAMYDPYSNGNWQVIFEVSYQESGSWLDWEAGMIDDQYFQWGTGLNEQPNREYQQQQLREQPMMEQQVSQLQRGMFEWAVFLPSKSKATLVRAGFRPVQNGLSPPAFQYDPRTGGYTGYRYPPAPPQVRRYAVNAAFGCAGAAAACRVAGPWTFQCVGGWCLGAAIAAIPTMFSN